MWKSLAKLATIALKPEPVLLQQLRTTFILKRRYQPYLKKEGSLEKRLRNKHFIYDLVKNTDVEKQPDIDIILTQYVDGLGKIGQRLSMRPQYAYNKLLLPGLAVYASPENAEKYKDYENIKDDVEHSSPTAQRAANSVGRLTLSVTMNKDNPWTLQPWHIRNCFRRCGYHVPNEAITMPKKPITGPNMDYQGKEFYVTVTINNLETVNVRCILHHWSTDVLRRLPHDRDFFRRRNDPIFPEDAEILGTLCSTQQTQPQTLNV